MDIESRSKIALLGGDVDWRTTPIARNDGLLADAKKFLEPDWWKRDSRGRTELAEVDRILQNAGLGKLKTRDDWESERDKNVKATENPGKSEGGMSASEISEHQKKQRQREREGADDAEEYESYMPEGGDILSKWFADLAIHVNVNTSENRPWYSALQSYIGKFPATATLDDVDEGTIREMVRMLCKGGAQ